MLVLQDLALQKTGGVKEEFDYLIGKPNLILTGNKTSPFVVVPKHFHVHLLDEVLQKYNNDEG